MVKKWVIRGIKSAVIGITVFVLIVVSDLFVTRVPVSKVWEAASDDPLPDRVFYAVAFPNSDSVELRDDEGNPCGPLSRAVLISLGEWESGGPIGVFVSATDICLAERADLTLASPTTEVSLAEAREFYLATFDPQLDAVRYFEHYAKDSGSHVVTTYMQDGDYIISEYRVAGDDIEPAAVWRYNSKAAAFDLFLTSVMATMMGIIAVALYWAILVVRWWWFRPRRPSPAA